MSKVSIFSAHITETSLPESPKTPFNNTKKSNFFPYTFHFSKFKSISTNLYFSIFRHTDKKKVSISPTFKKKRKFSTSSGPHHFFFPSSALFHNKFYFHFISKTKYKAHPSSWLAQMMIIILNNESENKGIEESQRMEQERKELQYCMKLSSLWNIVWSNKRDHYLSNLNANGALKASIEWLLKRIGGAVNGLGGSGFDLRSKGFKVFRKF